MNNEEKRWYDIGAENTKKNIRIIKLETTIETLINELRKLKKSSSINFMIDFAKQQLKEEN